MVSTFSATTRSCAVSRARWSVAFGEVEIVSRIS